ncbi:DUF2062 domain-containing protein [Sphingosinicella sp. CPCC 101087]|uniref:DUF2062 domain-containing protein n=1 Tax=Sphingosinicella sp. CPCC 101087 TaxID=2497754 RepID=UPI00101D97AE|nr:DUF2062 domain-containing protein [Sphingosinicella sp. CPCC 101087]
MVERITNWMAKNAPKREELAKSRWLKPFGSRVLHSEFWRFTRRSVPRGVAVGLFVGVFLLVPGVQIVGSALLAIPIRANIPVAAAMTFLTNPATTPFLLMASIWVGNRLGFHADLASFQALYARGASAGDWFSWLFSDAAPALVSGLFLIALLAGLVGYLLSMFVWRWWTARKWRRRAQRRQVTAD